MPDLNAPITQVPKIGTKYKYLLSKLSIETIEDLIYHFPFRYEDYSQIKKIKDLEEGDSVTVEAEITSASNIFTKNRKKITVASIKDSSGSLSLMWFNQHFIIKQLKKGETYRFSGKVAENRGKLTFYNPSFELSNVKNKKTARFVPKYPETAGVSSLWLGSRINDVLNLLDTKAYPESPLVEFLPESIKKDKDFIDFEDAIKKIHFPENNEDISDARKRLAFDELFLELLKVENRKKQWGEKNDSYEVEIEDTKGKLEKYISELPFELTSSQKEAVEEILDDMDEKNPMNRLLEGDVGTGKTIVAIIAAYLTVLNGYKVLYLDPTEILAKQHFKTFNEFLDGRNVNISLATGNEKIGEGIDKSADILIGTHALLYKQNFEKVGLIVIDEQHRFGVEQRTQILKMASRGKHTPHVLTMTATPIPRTLALTLYGDLSLSTLKTPPNKNKKITTRVIPEKVREETFEWIKKREEQAFIVCPLIEESESELFEGIKAAKVEFEKLKSGVFKDVPIGLLHGRMTSVEKQKVIEDFKNGKIKILVSTPVIEVGIDIPEATIMVIESAERYGLASLHQLRGRVGRGIKEGFCFVFMSNSSKTGYKRLKNLESISDGLKLAEIDMQIRGQGDIYGTMQHGFREFRFADIKDLEFLEDTKEVAQAVFKEIEKYPKLQKKIENYGGKWAVNN